MRKFFIVAKWLIILGILVWTISLCSNNKQLHQQLNTERRKQKQRDTVYIEKAFQVEKSYRQEVIPTKTTRYTKGFKKTNQDQENTDSVIQFKFDRDKLDLTYFKSKDSSVYTQQFQLDLDKYKYLYNNGTLTQQRRRRVKLTPYIQLRARPINQLYDLSGGVTLKTKHLNYSIGASFSYYPKFTNKIQKDIEASITYEF